MKDHDATEQAFKNGYEKAKQEVAREIFEEFEKCFDKRFGDWMFIHWKYAELKKKYIGDNK